MFKPLLVALSVVTGDKNAEPKAPEHKPANANLATVALPKAGETTRVGGGDAVVTMRGEGETTTFSADGVLTIDTPLPVGYPDPTPPGAIDLKRYPSVRRAAVSGEVQNLSRGGSEGFWPLFRHIQRRDIAMTSPVEMEYHKSDAGNAEAGADKDAKETWTMAFLYRRAEQGDAGQDAADQRVTVTDSPEMLVISVGMKGDYSRTLVEEGKKQLDVWLSAQTRFEKAGEARALYYHGPTFRPWRKWAEVQYPVREVAAPIVAREETAR
ncbi:MAG TPA: heme-binding protein [Phycisphaerales bacterium]